MPVPIDGHFFGFGFMAGFPSGTTELLGNWFIPVVGGSMVVFYFLITLLLRLLKRK